jgi:tRNA(Ile)-lysidine synthase
VVPAADDFSDLFDDVMAAFGPFEARPHIAVAVSGGGDSMALTMLAAGWARRRGGRLTGLTVDHGLRPGSASEARVVGWQLAGAGVGHVILRHKGARPRAGLQAAARDMRYRLLGDWCQAAGVFHLLVAHTQGDQAETLLLRLQKGSGFDGLAAMPAVSERDWGRVLRPLLGVSGKSLRDWLRRVGVDWIEDPSNRNEAFARVRLRRAMAGVESAGLTAADVAAAAAEIGRARSLLEGEIAPLLARTTAVHPAGFATVNTAAFFEAPPEIGRRALVRILLTIGGGTYPPRRDSLDRLYCRLAVVGGGDMAATLGGCRINGRGDALLVCREPRGPIEPLLVRPGAKTLWDRRFVIDVSGTRRRAGQSFVARLGHDGWRELMAAVKSRSPLRARLKNSPIPMAARLTLPVLRDALGITSVPHLTYVRRGHTPKKLVIRRAIFSPANGLSGTGFQTVL